MGEFAESYLDSQTGKAGVVVIVDCQLDGIKNLPEISLGHD